MNVNATIACRTGAIYHLPCPEVLTSWPENICRHLVPPGTKSNLNVLLYVNSVSFNDCRTTADVIN